MSFAIERELFTVMKSGVQTKQLSLFECFAKAAYSGKGRREGSPGNYQYYYDTPKPKRSEYSPDNITTNTLKHAADGDWKDARAGVDDALYESGPYYNHGGTYKGDLRDVSVKDQPKNIGGSHDWSGVIELSPDTAKHARDFAKDWMKAPKNVQRSMRAYEAAQIKRKAAVKSKYYDIEKRTRLEVKAQKLSERIRSTATAEWEEEFDILNTELLSIHAKIDKTNDEIEKLDEDNLPLGLIHLRDSDKYKTLVHETYHGYGPMRREAYESVGVVVEEVTTEVLARRDMANEFGVPKSWNRRGGSYSTWIDSMIDTIKKEYSTSEAKAWTILEEASDKLKKTSEGGDDAYKYNTQFVLQFPPTGDADKDKARWSLAVRHPVTDEYAELSSTQYMLMDMAVTALDKWKGPRE